MRIRIVGLLGICLLTLAVPAQAAATAAPTTPPPSPSPTPTPTSASTDPLALQLQAAAAEKGQIDAAKAALGGQVQAAHAQQGTLRDLITSSQAAIDTTVSQASAAEQRVHDARARATAERASAASARRRADQDRALLTVYARQRYTQRDGLLGYILSSDDLSTAFARAASMSKVMDRGTDLLTQLNAEIAAADRLEEAARKDAVEAETESVRLHEQEGQLREQVAHEGDLINELDAQARAAIHEIQVADGQDLALVQRIAELRIKELDDEIAKASEADWQAAQYYVAHRLGNVPGFASQLGLTPGSVRFVWPVPGSMFSQPFGPCDYPFEPPAFGYAHFHTGIDLAAPMGTPVYAAGDAVVVLAATSDIGYGNHLILAHDAVTLSLYGHLQTMLVKPGDSVHTGQLIGLMGSTGNSTGPHTHFELRVSGQPVDPTPFLPALRAGATGPPAIPSP